MQVRTRHTPAFGVARVILGPGEAVQARGESMFASSFGLTEVAGGRKAPSVFTAPKEGGWLDLAPAGAGDVYPLEFDGRTGWCIARHAVLARPASVRADSWPGLQAMFGAEHGFLEHYSGTGPLVLACAGPVDQFQLAAGELISVRPGHLLAYPDSVQCRLRALDPSGQQSIRTGEGLMIDFAGPGTLLVQARKSR
ncbi:AIM24 family protein [Amycolatopsis tucumanensis]|uniref:AIM24 family protein n=1 Tax=Amycolatopsis tucumanensis TaxID=401106 RepID=A0ABP7IZ08_9PSEU|nr:AIM24 family protein [Amycolatopsis tucumanensis]MCF6423438.1 AIM24 family protein [Amycolatopsis tucumanensis]